MPTYHACGVTARLTTCDLRPTLSGFTDLRMGGEQRKDALRIQKELSGGEKLGERPIGSDGSESGVVQFIGKNGDMPLFVVEASEHLRKKRPPPQKAHLAKQRISESTSDSSLTSLGATPDSTQEAFLSTAQVTEATAPKPQARSKTKTKSRATLQSALSLEQHTLEQALQSAHRLFAPDQQALVLEVDLGQESFLPTRNLSASLGKDLKIEIFVNGELAEVSFINARRSAAQVVGDKIRFAGTRVHRQTEKPWIYDPDAVASHDQNVEAQWSAISSALQGQAVQRGTDRFGAQQPSAEFLNALASIRLADRLKEAASIGVIDVIITGGKGQKYGPDTAYLTCPTHLDDTAYALANPIINSDLNKQSLETSLFDGGAVISSPRPSERQLVETSPDVPLQAASHAPLIPSSSSPTKRAMEIAKDLGLDASEEESRRLEMGSGQDSLGKRGPAARNFPQRVSDLKMMNENNQARDLQKLRYGFTDVFISGDNGEIGDERPAKRLRSDSSANYVDPSKVILDPRLMEIKNKMQEGDIFGAASVVNPQAVLTQNRIDMALDSGAASNGALLHRIASTSPVRTPRKTNAAALAYSPTRVEVKEQRSGRRKAETPTPQKQTPGKTSSLRADPGLSFATPQAKTDAASPSMSGRGVNRTASKWIPGEVSFSDALEAFGVPDLCRGSSVTYSRDGKAMRQIGKARGGTFREDAVVVGMRFVVW